MEDAAPLRRQPRRQPRATPVRLRPTRGQLFAVPTQLHSRQAQRAGTVQGSVATLLPEPARFPGQVLLAVQWAGSSSIQHMIVDTSSSLFTPSNVVEQPVQRNLLQQHAEAAWLVQEATEAVLNAQATALPLRGYERTSPSAAPLQSTPVAAPPAGRARVMGLQPVAVPIRPMRRTFHTWLEPATAGPSRRIPEGGPREARLREWGMPSEEQARPVVVCFARARRHYRNMTGGDVWSRLTHNEIMPSMMASYDQHAFLVGAGYRRALTVREGLRLLQWPLRDPMAQQLLTTRATPGRVLEDLGLANSVGVVRAIWQWALPSVGLPAGSHVSYGSAFSGLDAPRAALQWAGYRVHARFASEPHPRRQRLLRLTQLYDAIHNDAASDAATVHAPPVDVWVATFECAQFVPLNVRSSDAGRRATLSLLRAAMRYVEARRSDGQLPRVVLLENSADLPNKYPEAARELLRMLRELEPEYHWRASILCPTRHSAMPHRRRRLYLVGRLRRCLVATGISNGAVAGARA